MFYKALPNKIPVIWDLIKFAMQKSNNFKDDKESSAYLNELLHALLSGSAQCFIRSDENNEKIKTVIISRIIVHNITKEKYLLIQNYYAFKKSSPEEWQNNMNFSIEFAKKNGCDRIIVESSNPKIIDLASHFGYKERKVTLEYSLGGV
jgi:uncharacterized protein (UPF0262 family)